jgi:DNA repair protein RadC
MTIMVRDLPIDDRPREKLIKYGADCLSDTELLAILLRTGTHEASAIDIANQILKKFKESGLHDLVHLMPQELSQSVKGIGEAKAATILAAIELGRRLSIQAAQTKYAVVNHPGDAAHYIMPRLRFEQKEHFIILILDMKNHVLSAPEISCGSLSASIVHPREVFRIAIKRAAASIILCHNHPSGDPHPSREDIHLTSRLVEIGRLIDIPVLDHVIIGGDKYLSMKAEGMVK